MNNYFPERISIKLGAVTLAVGTVLGALALILITYLDLRSERQYIQQQLDTILTVSLPSARRAVHLYDEALAEEVVVGLLNYPFIASVSIYDEFGAKLVSKTQSVSQDMHLLHSWLLGEDRIHVGRDILLQHVSDDVVLKPGRIDLEVDLPVIYAPFWQRTLLHLVQISVLVLLLTCLLMLVFYLMVAKSLSSFAHSFSEVDPKNPGAKALQVPALHQRDELGQVAQISNSLLRAIGEHIKAREQDAQALRRKDERIRQILSDSPIGITVVNRAQQRLFINSRFIEMMGAESEQQLLDADIKQSFVHEEDCQRVANFGKSSDRTGIDALQIERRRLDGSVWWSLMDVRQMELEGERVTVNYHYDITERVKAEEENKRLEQRLETSKRLEMVGTLAGGIAHDFNNILTPILGYAQMAMEDLPADAPLRADLHEIEKAAKRAKKLIQQVLNFSRKQSGNHEQVVLEELVMDGISLIKASMPKCVDLALRIETPGIKVWGDPSQLDQVLMNLLTNAVDAIGDQSGNVLVNLAEFVVDRDYAALNPQLRPGSYAKLSVRDDGCGIDAQTQERIFDPFFTTKEPGKGTGVGLSTCHRITADHDGMISVYREPGQGTTFSVLLPLYGVQQRIADVVSGDDGEQKAAESQCRARLVFVDDDEKNVRFTERLLFRLGYSVRSFTSPLEAFSEIANHPDEVDLLITDRSMPELSGYELITRVRELLPDLPVVLVSGFAVPEEAQQLGIKLSGFISKPFEKDELAEVLSRLLGTDQTVTESDQQ
jgi:PAS domain S-box-containing protein